MISFNDFGTSGLGNQLFQIACMLNLSIENNCDFIVPRFRYDSIMKGNVKYGFNNNISNNYIEKDFLYSKIQYSENMNLNGYFQSELYFIDNKNKIIEFFEVQDNINYYLKNKYKNLNNSVSIHVRRGDYVPNDAYIKLDDNYYNDAINYIDDKKRIDNIFVISDDINWCKNNFNDSRIIFVEGNKDYEDLYFMSLCENNIIANSTFSWWGSYLNKNEDKIIVAPKNWTKGGLKYINDNNNIHTKEMYIINNNF